MRMYLENQNLHHPYITDCLRIYLANGDYVTLSLEGAHDFNPDFFQERFKGDAFVYDEFMEGRLVSYADQDGKDIENAELAKLFIEAKEIVCLIYPQISDEAEIQAGLWTSACDAVEGTGLKADGKIEIDLVDGLGATHTVSGKFTLATEVRL